MSIACAKSVLVYDVGGSHVAAAICSQHSYSLQGLSRAPLPHEFSASSFGRLIHTLGESAANTAGFELSEICGAALAMPGPFDYQNGVSHMTHKLHSLLNVDLKAALAQRFGWQPAQVRFLNDAAAFLLGELYAGAAKSAPRAVGLTLGTGIGSAFSIDGQIVTSGPGIPPGGEIWNLPYKTGIVEDYASTHFLRLHFQALTGVEAEVTAIANTAKTPEPCDEITSLPTTVPEVLTPYEAHCRARQAFQDFGHHLGNILNHILLESGNPFQPNVIVLGGGIARAAQLFLPETRKILKVSPAPTIVVSSLMDQAPLAGAGAHWFTTRS